MKLTAILGSPRQGSNTDVLLEKALETARDRFVSIEKIVLNNLNIRPCQECGRCLKTGTCQIFDDMAVIYEALDKADIVIIASPIFFGNVSAQAKTMIDRMQCFWARKYILKKTKAKKNRRGAFISCGGLKTKEYFKCAKKVIDIFFKVQDIEYREELFAGGIDEAGDILKHKDILQKAFKMGKRLVSRIKN
ncbi:MAG: flavodoxin family protein [Candidatus Omnitrophica bacterium]|nr:flavodoxin family protein [Candidatus Omnitrophota bacterium]